MADINNLNSGNSSSSYNNYPFSNNQNVAKVNPASENVEYSHNWKRMPRPFGLNVRVPQAPVVGERSQVLVKKILKDLVMAPVKPVIQYFKDNENVFNGNVSAEIESLQKQQKITVELLQDSDEIIMQAETPNFMMDM
ncbi:MAG: hypothetical protein K6E29_05260 [Cyanobacteria bacterium RUI128]|nr:hypothetical protein [Cyanobacteria bacterium RUI128]